MVTEITLHELSFKERRYLFKEALVFEVESPDGEGIVKVTCQGVPITGYGLTVDEAFSDFCCSLDFQWNRLVYDSEDNLTPGAIKVKRQLQKWIMVEVPPQDPKSLCQVDLSLLEDFL
jgi:hypothetical protein